MDKVTLPLHIASYLKSCKAQLVSLSGALDRFAMPDKVLDWMVSAVNQEVFASAWLYGFNVDDSNPARYCIPLPGLTTTDGEQQYLSQKGKHWFASRRTNIPGVRQEWKKEHLQYVPADYRFYAVKL